jgi:hypothetical protein
MIAQAIGFDQRFGFIFRSRFFNLILQRGVILGGLGKK